MTRYRAEFNHEDVAGCARVLNALDGAFLPTTSLESLVKLVSSMENSFVFLSAIELSCRKYKENVEVTP